MQYDIDLRAIKACAFAMSNEETRYYIKGVNLEIAPHGIVTCATDGHRLLAFHAGDIAPESAPESVISIIIPSDTVKKLKIKRNVYNALLRDMGAGMWCLEYGNEYFSFKPIEASFPDWRRVLPKHATRGAYAHFNPEYLLDFKKACSIYGSNDYALIANGENPAWIRFDDHVPGFGVIMPRRNDIADMVAPPWAGVELEKPAPESAPESAPDDIAA